MFVFSVETGFLGVTQCIFLTPLTFCGNFHPKLLKTWLYLGGCYLNSAIISYSLNGKQLCDWWSSYVPKYNCWHLSDEFTIITLKMNKNFRLWGNLQTKFDNYYFKYNFQNAFLHIICALLWWTGLPQVTQLLVAETGLEPQLNQNRELLGTVEHKFGQLCPSNYICVYWPF